MAVSRRRVGQMLFLFIVLFGVGGLTLGWLLGQTNLSQWVKITASLGYAICGGGVTALIYLRQR